MMISRYQGERLGACADCRRFWARYRAGEVSETEIHWIDGSLFTTSGTCAVMGTASTMAILCEVLGLMLPGTAAIPATMGLAMSGRSIDQIVTQSSIDNALRAVLAVSGSTSALVHLTAIAGRLGLSVDMPSLNRLSNLTPVLVDRNSQRTVPPFCGFGHSPTLPFLTRHRCPSAGFG
jgi:dihydroxy-acid dehydratase